MEVRSILYQLEGRYTSNLTPSEDLDQPTSTDTATRIGRKDSLRKKPSTSSRAHYKRRSNGMEALVE